MEAGVEGWGVLGNIRGPLEELKSTYVRERQKSFASALQFNIGPVCH